LANEVDQSSAFSLRTTEAIDYHKVGAIFDGST
jgi:hypothetical protein